MILYKHYSFDLWMTLIKSEPNFKMERAKYFYKKFNTKGKTIGEIISIFRKVDIMCNSINEKTGKNIDADEMYMMVISIINDFDTCFEGINLASLYDEMEVMFLTHMPLVYCKDTVITLDKIKQKNENTFSISSNTAFIKGITLRKVLSNLSLSPYFEFQVYSDEIGISKPDSRFFETMIQGIKNIDFNKDILLNEIIHIGDNPKADNAGAFSAGITGFLINSNDATILSLLN